jgi:hypothetical protein
LVFRWSVGAHASPTLQTMMRLRHCRPSRGMPHTPRPIPRARRRHNESKGARADRSFFFRRVSKEQVRQPPWEKNSKMNSVTAHEFAAEWGGRRISRDELIKLVGGTMETGARAWRIEARQPVDDDLDDLAPLRKSMQAARIQCTLEQAPTEISRGCNQRPQWQDEQWQDERAGHPTRSREMAVAGRR